MNINWKVRLQSKQFWAGILSAVVTAVFALISLWQAWPDWSQESVLSVLMLILQIPVAVGIITDPTTKGMRDSEQALSYQKPKEE